MKKPKPTTTFRRQIEAALAEGYEEIYMDGIIPGDPRDSSAGWINLRKWIEDGSMWNPSPLDEVISDPLELPGGGTVGLGRVVIGREVYTARKGR